MSKFHCEIHEVENGYLVIVDNEIGFPNDEYVAHSHADLALLIKKLVQDHGNDALSRLIADA